MKRFLTLTNIVAKRRILILPLWLLASALALRAEPYWVAWEGNDFPENEGWERDHYGADGPAADRSLADGIMTLDGLASIEITDIYRMYRLLNPEPAEEFVVQWRLRVNEIGNPESPFDPGIAIYSDDAWHFILVIGVNESRSILEQTGASFAPYVFHDWEFRSPDMRRYVLSIDGTVALTGTFTQSAAIESRISWGDLVFGAASHSDWDYFRFGVVPEPTSGISLLALLCMLRAVGRIP